MLNINLGSFHDYDIRGIYPSDINSEFFYHAGKSFALYIKHGPIGVGRDTRASSPELTASFIKGMTDYGVDVVDLGMISSEMHNYSSGKHAFKANIMITASHNPPQYNGIKSALHGVVPLHSGFGLPEVKAFMNQDIPPANVKGTVTKLDFYDEWIQHLLTQFDVSQLDPGVSIVVDAGNGMGGPTWQKLIEKLPVKVIPLYLDPDGTFPNHSPDPSKDQNLVALGEKVRESCAFVGLAVDGDADRAVFVDETGQRISGTVITALLAADFLKANKGVILFDATVGRIVPDVVTESGGTPMRTKVGHSFIKAKMKETQAIFAGEESGHYYFRENFNAESSALAALHILKIISEKKEKMSIIVKPLLRYARTGERNFKVEDGQTMIELLKKTYGEKAESISEIDGCSINFADWWFIIRLSKTEPLLRLFTEATSQELLDSKFNEVKDLLIKNGAVAK